MRAHIVIVAVVTLASGLGACAVVDAGSAVVGAGAHVVGTAASVTADIVTAPFDGDSDKKK